MSESLEDLKAQLATAHLELGKAQDAENEDAIYEWKQEVSALAKEVDQAQITRPFNAYEDKYGDYPF